MNAPVISGTSPFSESTQVSISGPDGADIRYTTDGSTPTASSSLYASPLTLSATTTVKAIAIKNGVSSSVATRTFTLQAAGGEGGGETPSQQQEGSETVEAPVISGQQFFSGTVYASITGPEGAEIRYTTDGTTPTASSSLYASPLTISQDTTVKAIAIKNGVSSSVASRTFIKSDSDE